MYSENLNAKFFNLICHKFFLLKLVSSKFGRFPAIQKGSIGSIMADERRVIIDEVELEVDGSMTLIQACEEAGIEIPRFCYHERLSIAGNCRMCLIEIVGGPQASRILRHASSRSTPWSRWAASSSEDQLPDGKESPRGCNGIFTNQSST